MLSHPLELHTKMVGNLALLPTHIELAGLLTPWITIAIACLGLIVLLLKFE